MQPQSHKGLVLMFQRWQRPGSSSDAADMSTDDDNRLPQVARLICLPPTKNYKVIKTWLPRVSKIDDISATATTSFRLSLK